MPNYKRLFIPNTYLFITIITNNRQNILTDNIELLRESFKRVKQIYNFEIFASVILSDHIHLLLKPEKIKEYPKIIRAVKYNFTQKINDGGMAIPPYEDENCRAGLLSCQNKTYGFLHSKFNKLALYLLSSFLVISTLTIS
jgi:REP element-mobilizing transposase RayT